MNKATVSHSGTRQGFAVALAFVAGLAESAVPLSVAADTPARAAYVPAPRPADTGRTLVGAIMCPLWNDGRRWGDIVPYPEREPLLGWYDEGDPEVTDWEITWALDHGISFFLVCWYRAKGNFDEATVRPTLGHWVHEGLPRSRYGNQFRFAIMWENANRALPTQTTEADFLGKLVPNWINEYFLRPNYLVIDGRPVFSIYNPEKFARELGGEAQAAAALAAMRDACVRAGFRGVHLLGQYCWGPPPRLAEQAGVIQRLGMDASWAYHWPTFTGAFGRQLRPTGVEAIAAQERLWREQPAPHLLTLSMGWDEAPWRFRYSKIQWRLTPAEFEDLCRHARGVLANRSGDGLADRVVLLDNWNEFGEGHYLLPTREHGFGYLEAVRRVFAPGAPAHTPITPAELGLGPYDSRYRAWRRAQAADPSP
jgi:hypothetical protein